MNLRLGTKYSWKKRGKSIYQSTAALLMPVIILGGICSIILSPMEAAAMACVWAAFAGVCLGGGVTLVKLWNAKKAECGGY